ncbi:DinB family protein [Solicola sp. PLA-1-18]|uniref:DinB family protein n=1 Tax=Solicola sp. PLA-1-18 TaxID=3380532 RepID=UPI003B7626D3
MGTEPQEFRGRDLRGARFVDSDLSGVTMRGVAVAGMEVESPWLFEAGELTVNGVNVVAYVDAELDRRFPGRELRGATTPDGMREAWAALQRTWAATLDRAAGLPDGTVDASVGGEWSFAQTLRHLVMATDMWLGRGVLRLEQPFHPFGLADHSMAEDGEDMSVFSADVPTWSEVLAARADRVAMVHEFLETVTADVLAEERPNPHDPAHPETVRQCLGTILEEEWEHHRYAVRDLDALESRR